MPDNLLTEVIQDNIPFDTPRTAPKEQDHSACGLGMAAPFPELDASGTLVAPKTHQAVEDGATDVANNEHRSGYNQVTGESDGAGLEIDGGLPTAFFNKKIREGEYRAPSGEVITKDALEDNQFVAGNFFLPTSPTQTAAAKTLIENSAKKNGLKIIGWRDLNTDSAVNNEVLSPKALAEKPAIWQAILRPLHKKSTTDKSTVQPQFNLERAALKTINTIEYRARKKKLDIDTVSLSAESMIFKGMIRPQYIKAYFKDLSDPDFVAVATSYHARFATNTKPRWKRAQPCPKRKVKHNGEFNSKPANASQHHNELDAYHTAEIHDAEVHASTIPAEDAWEDSVFDETDLTSNYDEDSTDPDFADEAYQEGYPDAAGSDSMHFDADAANQTLLRDIPLYEAVMRLLPARASSDYSPEINAMLQCFRLERAPYDGPALLMSNEAGYYFAKLDACALRPGRWGVTEDKQGKKKFFAASEDTFTAPEGGKILESGNIEAGGMIMLTPEGKLLHTKDILTLISQRYHTDDKHHFQNLLARSLVPLTPKKSTAATYHQKPAPKPLAIGPKFSDLNRILYAKGWDYEAIEQVLRHMADQGSERIGSMGDDTNILYSTAMPSHLAVFFHQLFAQVSSPPQDSVNEPENFSLATALGPALNTLPGSVNHQKQIALDSPILGMEDLQSIETNPDVKAFTLDMTYELDPQNPDQASQMRAAIKKLLVAAEEAAKTPGGGVLILSDKQTAPGQVSIPDLIAVAAVRKHLENKRLIRNVSILADSYQINGPHHSAALLALGANAVYARGAYAKINQLYENEATKKAANYRKATEKCLMKTMGKMGIPDVNNYINGKFVAALGLDLSDVNAHSLEDHPTLANIFPTIYSPLKGVNLGHIANATVIRHQVAEDLDNDFTLMPHAGHFMPEKGGIKHGYGPVVVNAFTEWMKKEKINETLWRLHHIFEQRGLPNFVADADKRFTPENGFLDPNQKDSKGYYPADYLARFKASTAFKDLMKTLDAYRVENPTSIRSNFAIRPFSKDQLRQLLDLPAPHQEKLYSQQSRVLQGASERVEGVYTQYMTDDERTGNTAESASAKSIQTTQAIRALLHAGNMSLGALTEPAHKSLRRGMKAIGAFSAAGEGGEDPTYLRDEFETTSSKQIASGRFGVSAMQILMADEIEIKVAQGAKPGEGGQLPFGKVTVQIAALRGGMPWTNIISPPPHHDIYSIEDLEQLIHDIKSVKKSTKVAVKLVASEGIGTIAVGVVKAGADVVSVASNDGGTGAAQQSSIKHTGMPAEIGIAEVDRALRQTQLRDLVELRMSGGFKTAEDIILATILGADQYELGTTLMITQNCKKQNTCDRSCQPGVAIDGHLFRGEQINTERYGAALADAVQDRLRELGLNNLSEIRGRTELLQVLDPELLKLYDFSAILDRSSACGMLQLPDSGHLPSYESLQDLFQGKDCVILFNDELYFANQCRKSIGKVRLHEDHLEAIAQLKSKCQATYQLANADDLDLITRATDNTFLPPKLTPEALAAAIKSRELDLDRAKEDPLIDIIKAFFKENPTGTYESADIALTTADRSFGARIAGAFAHYLEQNPGAQIILNTSGKAGQSYGFVLPKGMALNHTGGVQDGFGKSATGQITIRSSKLSKSAAVREVQEDTEHRTTAYIPVREDSSTVSTPQFSTAVGFDPDARIAVAGNALGYGTHGAQIHVAGDVGHRPGILNQGSTVVIGGSTGDLPFEFMLSGTGMVLGQVGRGLGASATGGIIFHYDPYSLCMLEGGMPIEKNKLYLEIRGESILYTVVDPKDSQKTLTAIMNVRNLDADFTGPITLAKLQPYLAKMLAITAQRGHTPKHYADAVRNAGTTEARVYENAIRTLLQEHVEKTGSLKAQAILNTFDLSHFKILIPKTLDNVKTLERLIDVILTYHQRESPITLGEQVWLEQKARQVIHNELTNPSAQKNRHALAALLLLEKSTALFTQQFRRDFLETNLQSLEAMVAVLRNTSLTKASMTAELRAWLGEKTKTLVQATLDTTVGGIPRHLPEASRDTLNQLLQCLHQTDFEAFKSPIKAELLKKLRFLEAKPEPVSRPQETPTPLTAAANEGEVKIHARKKTTAITELPQRLGNINGVLDQLLSDVLNNITAYASELKHDGTGCSGCRAQSCAGGDDVDTGCPSGKQINTINLILQQIGERPKAGPLSKDQWQALRRAFEVQIKESPFIAYTGAACPAPCQSACTETIAKEGEPNEKRGGKPTGEYVHIKDIEYDLFQLGRALGWFADFADLHKEWTIDEVIAVFGDNLITEDQSDPALVKLRQYERALKTKAETYDVSLKNYKAPFRTPEKEIINKKLLIVGSGPAAQQMAFEALRDGLEVEMYEQSDKPGGLITDGVPAHKFDKTYIKEYFAYLEKMGLKLHLNSTVSFDAKKEAFFVTDAAASAPRFIANSNDPNLHVSLCVGAGKPHELDPKILHGFEEKPEAYPAAADEKATETPESMRGCKLVPATVLLKKFNDIAERLSNPVDPATDTPEALIQSILGEQDPRGKKIVLIGGGDTAQDVIRWLARYFSMDVSHARGHLTIVIRGPKPVEERGIQDSYPALSQTPSSEYKLREEELEYVDGDSLHLVEPTAIHFDKKSEKLRVQLTQHQFKYYDKLQAGDTEIKKLYDSIPRNQRPRESSVEMDPIEDVDLIITAMGFQGSASIPLVKAVKEAGVSNYSLAGDAATGPKLIVTAQNSGHETYQNFVKPAMGIHKAVSLSTPLKPTANLSALAANSLFAASKSRDTSPTTMKPATPVDDAVSAESRPTSALLA